MSKNKKSILTVIALLILFAVSAFLIITKLNIYPHIKSTSSEIDPIEEINKLFYKQERVSVIITLRGNEFTSPDYQLSDDIKIREVTAIQNDFLSSVTEEDFILDTKYKYIPSVVGLVSKTGLDRLLKNDKVLEITLNSVGTFF